MDTVLEPRCVGELEGEFFIPAYQRGYRWGTDDVQRLLDDIEASGGEPYYLQPVVVKPMPDGRWELIDGQQRMTTLYLILQYIHRTILPSAEIKYTLEYEVRPGSWGYLQAPDQDDRNENVDFFHIAQADQCIRDWFEARSNPTKAGIDLYSRLAESVRVLWYQAPEHVNATTLFTRLNVGRIPLTDAELVKALLLTRSEEEGGTARAHEVAAQWDGFERDLRGDEVWAFVSGHANAVPTHISLLLDSLADSRTDGDPLTGRDRPTFHTFETLRPYIDNSPDEFWRDVVRLHSRVMGWYDDRDIFHKVGFLVGTGHSFQDLVELADDQTRTAFSKRLDQQISHALNLTTQDLRDLAYTDGTQASRALFLMNVETVRRREDSSQRYSFQAHANGSWSLEHIHAQGSEGLKTVEEWTEWLRLHRDALKTLPGVDETARDDLVGRIDTALPDVTGSQFRELQDTVNHMFTDSEETADDVNSIANLALLGSGDNSALNNAAFEVKRRRILERDQAGSYVPACTRNVFLKYYTRAEGQQVHFWGRADREAYLDAMEETLAPHLKPEQDA